MMILVGDQIVDNQTWWGLPAVSFQSPIQNVSDYCNITMINPDGGVGFFVDAIYYTDQCPYPGTVRCGPADIGACVVLT